MAFPYLMYLASVGTCSVPSQAGGNTLINTANVVMGIVQIYHGEGASLSSVTVVNSYITYLSICIFLNALLALMIIVRLVVHTRNFRKAIGVSGGSSGSHTTTAMVVTMLIESYALYVVSLIPYTVSWAVHSPVSPLFSAFGAHIQVCATFLLPDMLLS